MTYENTENFYVGSYSPLDPGYGELFTGYRVPFQNLGAPTSIQTANQIAEVSSRLNEGMRVVELQPISPELFETIPKDHLKETARLMKLTGAEATLHAPIVDPAGFNNEGSWSEPQRQISERQFENIIDRAHELSPQGNMPVTFHATIGLPSTIVPKVGGPSEEDIIHIVNQDTGQIQIMRREKKLDITTGKEEWLKPDKQLEDANRRNWNSQFGSIIWEAERARESINQFTPQIAPVLKEINEGKIKEENLLPAQTNALGYVRYGQTLYDQVGSQLKMFISEAVRLWPEGQQEEYREQLKKIKRNMAEIEDRNLVENNPIEASRRYNEVINTFRKLVKDTPPPRYSFTSDFALKKSRETIANVALKSFKKFGDSAPIISMENVMPGTVFGTGGELADLIKESREAFVKKARAEGISESQARDAANKLIGATWDIGHLNLMRKQGFEEKGIKEETKQIAPFVKHVHLTDNFGFTDSHLPPGMGNVPVKAILQELEKAGYKGKEIVEAGGFVSQFKTSPTPYVLEAFGSPIYGMQMPPFWNQVRNAYGVPAGYSSGYGLMLPEQHMGIYGAGFASIPMDLGGATPGKGQRFSGTPME